VLTNPLAGFEEAASRGRESRGKIDGKKGRKRRGKTPTQNKFMATAFQIVDKVEFGEIGTL